jgi:hypothetical protein
MPLKLRPTGLGSGIDKDRPDYSVYTGEWEIGRIYEVRGGPDHLRWFWSFTLHGPMTRSDRADNRLVGEPRGLRHWTIKSFSEAMEERGYIKQLDHRSRRAGFLGIAPRR